MTTWNGWYHVDGNTYGTWLHGDHRGWRTRHHRTHVPYDYKNPPPPEVYERLEKHSLASMKDAIVFLTPPQRKVACDPNAASLAEVKTTQVIDLQRKLRGICKKTNTENYYHNML